MCQKDIDLPVSETLTLYAFRSKQNAFTYVLNICKSMFEWALRCPSLRNNAL
jgi:hypothetical protein